MIIQSLRAKSAIFRDQQFRVFFAGSAISSLGDGLLPVAFALAAYSASGSGSGITLVLLSLWVTRFLTVPVGGRLADRYSRLKIILAADLIRLVAQGGLAAAISVSGRTELWQLCASAALYGIGTGLYVPAQIGLVPRFAPSGRLRDANSMFSIVADVTSLAGPVFAGLVMTSLGFRWILWLDCLTFGANLTAVVWLLARNGRDAAPDLPDSCPTPGPSSSHDMRFIEGLRLIRSFSWFQYGVLLWFVISAGIGVVAVAGPITAVSKLGGTYAWVVLSTCLALGSLLGSLVIASLSRDIPWRIAAVAVAVGFCAQLLALACADRLSIVAVSVAFMCGSGVIALCGVVWCTHYQSEIPDRYLARMGSIESFLNSVGVPIGMAVGGAVSSHLGVVLAGVAVLVVMAGVAAVSTAGKSPVGVAAG
ncbi:MAG: MFS transporter [Actinomycetota bacterium]|nr:MFS transporter [Actinomycetota bacterium]